MLILICAATEAEINESVNFFKTLSLPFELQFLTTGVGLTPTTYHLTKYLTAQKPQLVIQAGIAGTFNTQAPLCQTFAIQNDCFADVGVYENNSFQHLFNLALLKPDAHPFTNGRLKNPHRTLLAKTALPVADAVSVNEITTSEERINYYNHTFAAAVESMEGAAFHYVCLMEDVPFVQIRTTSNYIGERNKANWQLKDSIACLNKELQRILLNIEL